MPIFPVPYALMRNSISAQAESIRREGGTGEWRFCYHINGIYKVYAWIL